MLHLRLLFYQSLRLVRVFAIESDLFIKTLLFYLILLLHEIFIRKILVSVSTEVFDELGISNSLLRLDGCLEVFVFLSLLTLALGFCLTRSYCSLACFSLLSLFLSFRFVILTYDSTLALATAKSLIGLANPLQVLCLLLLYLTIFIKPLILLFL